MIRFAGLLRFLAGLLLVAAAPAVAGKSTTDAAIDRWIEAHARKLKGVEQPMARYAVVGDLDGDGRHDVAVLYTIDDASPGNRSLRYLAAFHRSARALEFKAHALVGGRGIREVNRATILGRMIELETLEYAVLDEACCPSTAARARYRLTEGRLVRVKAPKPGAQR
ncbi:MAG: hypothetical protein OEZ08_03710 [Betaproteobacteria bacterium]|nr:hypothetical protein [Betaproteobacteria bacterium]